MELCLLFLSSITYAEFDVWEMYTAFPFWSVKNVGFIYPQSCTL